MLKYSSVICLNIFLQSALDEAKKAFDCGEVPVGAVVVKNGEVISSAHNLTRKHTEITAHAEILAICEAEKKLGDWRLDECELYVTLEPCMMCMGAIINSRIKKVYFGAYDKDFGFALSNHFTMPHNVEIYGGICEDECKNILKAFFESRRN